ncbi:MAG TPA: hypothetical protein VFB32_15915 [Rudaea sp.]|nr:hypothetical protein [Rudaea sp.]
MPSIRPLAIPDLRLGFALHWCIGALLLALNVFGSIEAPSPGLAVAAGLVPALALAALAFIVLRLHSTRERFLNRLSRSWRAVYGLVEGCTASAFFFAVLIATDRLLDY